MSVQQEQQSIVVNSELELVLTPILARLDKTIKDSQNLLQLINEQKLDSALEKIAFFLQEITSIEEAQHPILAQLEHSYTVEMLDNLKDVLERIQQVLTNFEQTSDKKTAADFMSKAQFLCEFQFIPMLRNTRRSFYFWGRVDKDPELLKRYYAEEFAQASFNPYVASGKPLPYQVSVVVVAYNKLSMTKRCVESILENTDFERLQAELILVDHGSSDGTLEYFESIPHAKVLHFKRNILVSLFPMLPQICLSPFYVHVANDTVVTKDWLDILLACMKSDPKIATASPATCNITNYQGVSVPVDDCKELVKVAKTHNKINPLLWNERVQIYPPLGIFSISILNQIGFWDPALYTFYTCDDDLCFTARRAGFKMILCEDVFCYHQGRGTYNSQPQKSIEMFDLASRLFNKKRGMFPWGLGTTYNIFEISALQKELETNQQLQSKVLNSSKALNLLLINGGAGDTALQLKNVLRRKGKQLNIYHLQTTTDYVDDIKHMAADYVCSDHIELSMALQQSFSGVEFSFICSDSALDYNILSAEFCEILASRLQDGGIFYFSLVNDLYVHNAKQIREFMSTNKPLDEWCSLSYSKINHLLSVLLQYVSIKNIVQNGTHDIGVDVKNVVQLLSQFYKDSNASKCNSIFIKEYMFVCQK